MRLTSLSLIDYNVKWNFFDLICYLVHFYQILPNYMYIMRTHIQVPLKLIYFYCLKTTLILTTVKYFCCQSVGALKGVLSSYK